MTEAGMIEMLQRGTIFMYEIDKMSKELTDHTDYSLTIRGDIAELFRNGKVVWTYHMLPTGITTEMARFFALKIREGDL